MAVSGYQWHAAGVEVVWAPPGGGDVAGPLAAAGCPAAASSLSTERRRTVKGGQHPRPPPGARPTLQTHSGSQTIPTRSHTFDQFFGQICKHSGALSILSQHTDVPTTNLSKALTYDHCNLFASLTANNNGQKYESFDRSHDRKFNCTTILSQNILHF